MNHLEHQIQKSIVQFLRLNNILHCAIPNGELRDARVGVRLKAEGVVAGAPDLVLFLDRRCLCVEVKTPAGRHSPAQKAFKTALDGVGIEYVTWRSVDDAVAYFRENKR